MAQEKQIIHARIPHVSFVPIGIHRGLALISVYLRSFYPGEFRGCGCSMQFVRAAALDKERCRQYREWPDTPIGNLLQ